MTLEPILYTASGVAIIDPPWSFKAYSSKGNKKSPKYSLMEIEALRALRPCVNSLLAKDAVVLMWSTSPHLASAMALLTDWGLTYKSYMVWAKDRQAMGYWSRSNCEIVLVATKGKPRAPKMGTQGLSLFRAPPMEQRNSAKPETLHHWAEKHYPEASKLELFARRERDGWNCIGNELGKQIMPHGIFNCKINGETNVCV